METSILIAKILSVAYLSLGWGILMNRTYYKSELIKMMDNSSFVLFAGIIAIVFGFVIIEFHNTWHKDWTTMIAVVGWLALIKGITLLAFPKLVSFYKRTIFHSNNFSTILIPSLLILGILFGYFGFIY